jgi:hypothetical protein
VTEFFRKGDGVLWAFYNENLRSLFTPQGRATGTQSVRTDFQQFFRRAVDFSEAVYRDGPPLVVFDFQVVQFPENATEVLLELNRATATFSPSSNRSREMEWNLERGQSASLAVRFGSERREVAEATGSQWAVFKIFRNTSWQDDGGRWIVTWNVPGQSPLKVAINFQDHERPVLRESFYSGFSCPGRILN